MSEWKSYKLGDLAVFNYGKSLVADKRNNGTIPVYSSSGISGWHDEALVESEAIIVGRKGNVGSVFYTDKPFYCIDTAYYILPSDKYDLKFLYYKLQSLNLIKLTSDSAVPGLNRETAYSQEIEIPEDLELQIELASILVSLDNKIELNIQMNQILEAMALAIFKEWFVNFNFPGFDGELVDGVPKGWTETTLNEAVDLIIDHRGKTPTKLGSVWVDEGIPALSAKNVKDGRIINLSDVGHVDEELYKRWMKEELQTYDILLTSEAPLGEAAILISNTKYCLSQRLFAIRANNDFKASFLYFYLRSAAGKDNVAKRATGSTVVGIRQSELRKVEVLSPKIDVQTRFDNVVKPLIMRIDENYNEINTLTQLRDSLLPKLMSRKIELKN